MNDLLNMITPSFFDAESFIPLIFRFLLNGTFAFILIERIYFRINKQREYLFTLFIFNILIFFVASLLANVKMKTGFAFGLFAIFSILRYRTEQINIKEMTFLFASIILAVTNSMVTIQVPLLNILFANFVIISSVYMLERTWLKSFNRRIDILFDDIELINTDRHHDLIQALNERTGFRVTNYEINSIDYLRDTAQITVYYE